MYLYHNKTIFFPLYDYNHCGLTIKVEKIVFVVCKKADEIELKKKNESQNKYHI